MAELWRQLQDSKICSAAGQASLQSQLQSSMNSQTEQDKKVQALEGMSENVQMPGRGDHSEVRMVCGVNVWLGFTDTQAKLRVAHSAHDLKHFHLTGTLSDN
jgi:hypothetical protein